MTTFTTGNRIVIRYNPHHAHAKDLIGTVVKVRPREGFGGIDLLDVEYVDPWTGETEVMPFGERNLSPGAPELLRDLAMRYEALALELRQLADGGPQSDVGEPHHKPTDNPKDES